MSSRRTRPSADGEPAPVEPAPAEPAPAEPAPAEPAPAEPAPAEPVVPHTRKCRVCGTALHLSETELLASLDAPPICWPCDTRR